MGGLEVPVVVDVCRSCVIGGVEGASRVDKVDEIQLTPNAQVRSNSAATMCVHLWLTCAKLGR